ncbi:MAG: hypothetical protein J6333_05480 [Planctomycetes bacterium]|nr:hypothetical protein [Planctomycetota bacterium]
MLKFSWLSLLAAVLCCGQSLMAAEYAEDRQPKKELAPDEKEEAENLRKTIAAEKERLKKYTDPINKIKEDLKKPTAENKEKAAAQGRVTRLLEKVKESKKITDDDKKKIKEEGEKVSKAYAKEALTLATDFYGKGKADGKGVDAQARKMRDAGKQATLKIENQIQKLEEKKAEAEAALRGESGDLLAARAKLDAINGYSVAEGMSAALFAGSTATGGEGQVIKWLDGEINFIDMLNRTGNADLAAKHLARLEKEDNPFTGKPFTSSMRSYLSKANAKVLLQKALAERDVKAKMLMMQDVLKMYAAQRDRAVPMTPMFYDAGNDLVHTYFRCADDLREVATAQAAILGSAYKPAAVVIPGQTRAPANPKDKGKAAPAPQKIEELQKDKLDAMDAKAANDLALARAEAYYQEGINQAVPLAEKINELFGEVFDNYTTARDEENAQEEKNQLKLLERVSPYKARAQHSIESGYAGWAALLVGSPEQAKILKAADQFIANNLEDYQAFWPDDKNVYLNWLPLLGAHPDPILAKGDDGKPRPRLVPLTDAQKKSMSQREQKLEMSKLSHYAWFSDQARVVFDRYIVGGDREKGKDDRRPFIQAARMRGLYAYGEALTTSARVHYTWADAESDAAKKTALLKHADELDKAAEAVLEDLAQEKSAYVGTLDDGTRYNAMAKIAVPYYLFLANRGVQRKDTGAAQEAAQKILTIAAALVGSADPAAKQMGNAAMATAQEFGKKHDLKVGGSDPEDMPPSLLASTAERIYKEAIAADRKRDTALAEDKFRESRGMYLLALDKARNVGDKTLRDRIIPKALYSLAVTSVKLKDYETAYVASQMFVQEFRSDFKDPSLNYPHEQFPNTKNYWLSSLNNLRAAAALRVREDANDSRRRDYIDALLLCVRYSNNNQDYLTLINAFKQMKDYASAARFIDGVDADNPYHNMAQLMGAGIYLDLAKQDAAALKKIDATLNPPLDDEGKPVAAKVSDAERAKLTARKTALEAEITDARAKATQYASKFLALHQASAAKWAAEKDMEVPEYLQHIRKQESDQVLAAKLIPLTVAHASGQWDQVVALVPAFLKDVDAATEVPEETKQKYRDGAAWMAFDAVDKRVDFGQVPLAEGMARIEDLEKAAAELAKIDTTGQYESQAASIIGNRATRLSKRAEKAGDEAAKSKFDTKAVAWMEKAENRIYEHLSGGVQMIAILAEQKEWARAINIGEKVVSYWGESKFTENSLFQRDKGKDDVKEMAKFAKASLGTVFDAAAIASAARGKPADFAGKLNAYVTLDREKTLANVKAYQEALKGLLSIDKHPRQKVLAQAEEIANGLGAPDAGVAAKLKTRPYLLDLSKLTGFPAQELCDQLNRTMLEAAYPEALYQRPYTPVIPTPATFVKKFDVPPYSSAAGRDKAAVLMAMIDPESNVADARKVFGADYPKSRDGGLLKEWKEKVAAMPDGAEKARWQRQIAAVETPLIVSLYGEPDKSGRKRSRGLVRRSYPRARATIAAILEYEKANPTSDFEGKFPLKPALDDLAKALATQNTVLNAKKNYATAMVENGQFAAAEKYVRDLCASFPTDNSLQLKLAYVYAAMATYQEKDGKLTPRPYGTQASGAIASPAALFNKAMAQAISVYSATPSGSESWWEARMLTHRVAVAAIEARKKAGPAMSGALEDVEVEYLDPVTGKSVKSKRKINPLDDYELPSETGGDPIKKVGMGRAEAINLLRDLTSVDPVPSDEIKAQLQEYLDRLNKIGYSAEFAKVEAEPETPAPAAAKDQPQDDAKEGAAKDADKESANDQAKSEVKGAAKGGDAKGDEKKEEAKKDAKDGE